jgi:MFS family permease
MKLHSAVPAPNRLFAVLVMINFLNYTDRSILPGSANEFIQFISSSLATSKPDIYLGFLQSAFIVGFTFASVFVSHLVHYYGPFYLCAVGLSFWVFSAVLCSAGYYFNSYSLLLIGRMLSGVGEASFVCIVPPWITKHSPPGQKGIWLSIFYTALPVG